jgi:alkylhydroperoxidase domain protein
MTSDLHEEHVLSGSGLVGPDGFTQQGLGWSPWLAPLPVEEFEQRHWDGVIEQDRAKTPYFALLAREPEVLAARTLTDFDIFQNAEGGLPLAERELSAAAASRVNGCVFCASVHARQASRLSDRTSDVEKLLGEGTAAHLDDRWDALVEAARALTVTPSEFSASHIERLRDVGLSDVDIADVVAGAAFFNWANRLMLSLGEPTVPRRGRS